MFAESFDLRAHTDQTHQKQKANDNNIFQTCYIVLLIVLLWQYNESDNNDHKSVLISPIIYPLEIKYS